MRLHGIDENHAGEVAELLAYFRSLQRQLDLSVLLVHHTRKNAAGEPPPAKDCAAPVTSMPSATRTCICGEAREHLVLSSEHRAAPASAPVYLELVATNAETTHLEVIAELRTVRPGSWRTESDAVSRSECSTIWPGARRSRERSCRDSLAVKNERLGEALESLERAGQLCRTSAGWQRPD